MTETAEKTKEGKVSKLNGHDADNAILKLVYDAMP